MNNVGPFPVSAVFGVATIEKEDVEGTRVCKYPELHFNGCPGSGELLSLHYIEKMPDDLKNE